VTSRATELGYFYGNPEWANFGQGAPEVGQIPEAEPRPTTVTFHEEGESPTHSSSPPSPSPSIM
jgi:hypothetical protein